MINSVKGYFEKCRGSYLFQLKYVQILCINEKNRVNRERQGEKERERKGDKERKLLFEYLDFVFDTAETRV